MKRLSKNIWEWIRENHKGKTYFISLLEDAFGFVCALPPRQASEAQTRSSSLTCLFCVAHGPHDKPLHSLGFSM